MTELDNITQNPTEHSELSPISGMHGRACIGDHVETAAGYSEF